MKGVELEVFFEIGDATPSEAGACGRAAVWTLLIPFGWTMVPAVDGAGPETSTVGEGAGGSGSVSSFFSSMAGADAGPTVVCAGAEVASLGGSEAVLESGWGGLSLTISASTDSWSFVAAALMASRTASVWVPGVSSCGVREGWRDGGCCC